MRYVFIIVLFLFGACKNKNTASTVDDISDIESLIIKNILSVESDRSQHIKLDSTACVNYTRAFDVTQAQYRALANGEYFQYQQIRWDCLRFDLPPTVLPAVILKTKPRRLAITI